MVLRRRRRRRRLGDDVRGPEDRAGPAEVVVADDSGWSASAGTIEILHEARGVSFRVGGRLRRSAFQWGSVLPSGFVLGTTAVARDGALAGIDFSVPADLRSAPLPATFTDRTPGASLELGCAVRGRAFRWWGAGTWELTVDRIADGEAQGSFRARMNDESAPNRHATFTHGTFRVAVSSAN